MVRQKSQILEKKRKELTKLRLNKARKNQDMKEILPAQAFLQPGNKLMQEISNQWVRTRVGS